MTRHQDYFPSDSPAEDRDDAITPNALHPGSGVAGGRSLTRAKRDRGSPSAAIRAQAGPRRFLSPQ